MKKLIFPIVILFCITQQTTVAQSQKNDRLFIAKDSLKGYSQSIFFETDTNSKFYDNLTLFKFSDFDKAGYNKSINYLKSKYQKLTPQKTILPFTQWIILKQYKGQYCAYHQCDGVGFYRATVNDTTFIDWTTEGCEANKIISQKKISNNVFELNINGNIYKNRTITFTIIDPKKEIAIVEADTKNGLKNYLLMISADKIKTIPFIVNNCEFEKQDELEFDITNFKVLLNKVKK
jgi:hypothetical protein